MFDTIRESFLAANLKYSSERYCFSKCLIIRILWSEVFHAAMSFGNGLTTDCQVLRWMFEGSYMQLWIVAPFVKNAMHVQLKGTIMRNGFSCQAVTK